MNSKIVSILFICFALFLINRCSNQQITPDGCFKQYNNVREKCMAEVERRTGISQQDCTNLCLQHIAICKAAQYNKGKSQCDLFSASNQLSSGKKKRSPHSGGNRGRGPPPFKGGTLKGSGHGSHKGSHSGHRHGSHSGHRHGGRDGDGGRPPVNRCDGMKTLEGNCPDFIYFIPTVQCQNFATTPSPIISTTPQLPSQATCPVGLVVRYMLIKGYQLSGSTDYTFNAANEEACVEACSNNKLPDGSFAPCQSADYNTQMRQCQIFLNAAPPTGTGTLNPAASTNHYEKICLDENTANNCPGPIIRAPQKVLVGYAETVSMSNGFSDCMEQCANAKTRFGFSCLSGQYYYTETMNNCILNSESATTKPSLYTDDSLDKVDYFEPECTNFPSGRRKRSDDETNLQQPRRRSVIWLRAPEWGSWTRCDGKVSSKKRYRKCSSYNPNHCMLNDIACDPTNRAKEWEEIRQEEFATSTSSQGTTISTVDNGTDDFCEPVRKLDGSKDCNRGFRKRKNGRPEPCSLKQIKNSC